MSKGNPVLKMRLTKDLLSAIRLQIAQRNAYTPNEPWTVSDFLRVAAWEKLQKMERSRQSAKRRASAARKGKPPEGSTASLGQG